jgi:hypothetical protein
MNDSDGSHSCRNMAEELMQDDPDDPGSQCLSFATDDVNGRRSSLLA